MQWGPLLPKGEGMIQEDIGGHPPIPLGPHHCFFQFSTFLNCSTIYYFWQFLGPKLRSRFEALNNVFWHGMVKKIRVHFRLNVCHLWMYYSKRYF